MLRRLAAVLLAVMVAAPAQALALAKGPSASSRKRLEARNLEEGFLYMGSAPGVNFGGHALPRALYMDVVQAGYVMPSGLELGLALSGMNFIPDAGDYSISVGRLAVGYRPFLRDPLPVLQPFVRAGVGAGGEGRYLCEPEPSCDPETDVCRDVCGRSNWAMSLFGGAGIDFNAHLTDIAGQQLMVYAGVEARYEYIPDRYHMGVLTVPVGIKLQ